MATCQLATWAENTVTFELSKKKWKRKPKKNEARVEWEAQ